MSAVCAVPAPASSMASMSVRRFPRLRLTSALILSRTVWCGTSPSMLTISNMNYPRAPRLSSACAPSLECSFQAFRDCAFHIPHQQPRDPSTPGHTLYIQAEIPEPQLQKRLRLMLGDCPGVGRVDAETLRGRLLTVTRRGLFIDEPDGYDAVRRLIEEHKPDLVSLDPLARFMTGEENSARDVGRLINSLNRLIQEYRIAIELTHHAGKPSNGDPRQGGQRLRGSSALFGAADSVTMLDRTQDSWTLTFELRHAEEPAPMSLDRTSSLWFTAAGPPEKLKAVAELVKDIPMRYSTLIGAIVTDTKCSQPTAER